MTKALRAMEEAPVEVSGAVAWPRRQAAMIDQVYDQG
jgi:hypothetical protein